MLQPLQSLLSSVVENAALLVGAVAACCLQSWQLTLLAATTLLPATYVTQLCAHGAAGRARCVWLSSFRLQQI